MFIHCEILQIGRHSLRKRLGVVQFVIATFGDLSLDERCRFLCNRGNAVTRAEQLRNFRYCLPFLFRIDLRPFSSSNVV